MAPPKSQIQFDQFVQWLKDQKQLKAQALRSYHSYIRHAVSTIPGEITDPQAVLTYFDSIAGRSDYYNRRTAWKSFAEWYFVTHMEHLPTPSANKRDLIPDPLPPKVIAACQDLVAHGMNVDAIFDSTWERVDIARLLRNSDTTTVAAKYGRGINYSVPATAMRALFDFTFPNGTGGNDRPLVPSRAGSYTPYPKEKLREAIRVDVGSFKPEPVQLELEHPLEFDIQGFIDAYRGQE